MVYVKKEEITKSPQGISNMDSEGSQHLAMDNSQDKKPVIEGLWQQKCTLVGFIKTSQRNRYL